MTDLPFRGTALTALVATCVCAVLAPPAEALVRKPKPVCNLLVDPADVPGSPALDVLSADVASNKSRLAWVIRVKSLAPATDPNTATGRIWTFVFKVGDKQVTTSVVDGPLGTRDGSGNGAAVKLDVRKNEVSYVLPLAKISSAYGLTITPSKSVLSGFAVTTAPGVELPEQAAFFYTLPGGDTTAASSKTYKASVPSCVVVPA